ncbi:MAG: hypothetical protein LBG19_04305 [Prevotellaceae bacterium]|nr:hypothetical protein [Prevotellaceae bacterium]
MLLEKDLLRGINHILIADRNGNIYAERMFFVYPSTAISSTLNTNKETYEKREKSEITLELKDNNDNPIEGTFSFAVTDSFIVPYDENQDNLSSYMLLSSELSGAIEDSGDYFNPAINSREREAAMDLLMMVQGWKYYDIPSIFTSKKILLKEKEYAQQISGKASSLYRRAKNASIFILAPSINLTLAEILENDDRFIVDDLDFPDSAYFIIAASKKSDKNNMFIDIDKESFPLFTTYQSFPKKASKKTIAEYEDIAELSRISSGQESHYVLEEAEVKAPVIYRPKYNPSPYNQSFNKNAVKERKDPEPFDALII